jgi:hypothetical protein
MLATVSHSPLTHLMKNLQSLIILCVLHATRDNALPRIDPWFDTSIPYFLVKQMQHSTEANVSCKSRHQCVPRNHVWQHAAFLHIFKQLKGLVHGNDRVANEGIPHEGCPALGGYSVCGGARPPERRLGEPAGGGTCPARRPRRAYPRTPRTLCPTGRPGNASPVAPTGRAGKAGERLTRCTPREGRGRPARGTDDEPWRPLDGPAGGTCDVAD